MGIEEKRKEEEDVEGRLWLPAVVVVLVRVSRGVWIFHTFLLRAYIISVPHGDDLSVLLMGKETNRERRRLDCCSVFSVGLPRNIAVDVNRISSIAYRNILVT